MKIWNILVLFNLVVATACLAQDDSEIKEAFSNLGSCLEDISTQEMDSGKSNPVHAVALLTSVYKNMAYESGSIPTVEEKYIKLYQLANEHCSQQIVSVKKVSEKKSK